MNEMLVAVLVIFVLVDIAMAIVAMRLERQLERQSEAQARPTRAAVLIGSGWFLGLSLAVPFFVILPSLASVFTLIVWESFSFVMALTIAAVFRARWHKFLRL